LDQCQILNKYRLGAALKLDLAVRCKCRILVRQRLTGDAEVCMIKQTICPEKFYYFWNRPQTSR
jgi:hypothetical protein